MTYVSEQTSAELRQHMKRLKAMHGWNDPLSDRLWREVLAQDAIIGGLELVMQVEGGMSRQRVTEIINRLRANV